MPNRLLNTFPEPGLDAVAHSQRLTELMRKEIIASQGWISFSRYMDLALYAPGLGYYTAGSRKFGMSGDFVTAPEISPLFGRTLARQVAEIVTRDAPNILELGAGSGRLAVDVLAELEQCGVTPDSYSVLEVSADLREKQQELVLSRFPNSANRMHWLDELPRNFRGVIIANEVLDALPVHLVHWQDNVVWERGVALEDGDFVWQEREIADPALLAATRNVEVPDGYVSEICLAARGLVSSIGQALEQGIALFIDYGFGAREFFHPQRGAGTLMCHYRHRAHADPFLFPGLQDITSHVNFTDIAEAGIDAGLELYGYTSQAHFLINCGIMDLLKDTPPDKPALYLPLSSQLQKLTSPAEMGELFKVMALGRNVAVPLCGFDRGDLTRLL